MLYFWIALFTLIVSSVNYSMHMDAFLYMQKQKKIADEQAILEYILTSSKYMGEIIAEDKNTCFNVNKCTELLQNRLKNNNYTVNNNVKHCVYNGKITIYYKSNNNFYDSVLGLYKKHGVQNLENIENEFYAHCKTKTSSRGVYIQQNFNQ
ncbi:hypothetical protein [Escherichia coli]|uniref:hypothetical protein n=1 Tax=Escherichia coli TaxID=562 RepID=UPI000BE196C8|nr:hypothetical protein [Escherichia coli]